MLCTCPTTGRCIRTQEEEGKGREGGGREADAQKITRQRGRAGQRGSKGGDGQKSGRGRTEEKGRKQRDSWHSGAGWVESLVSIG